VSAVRQACCREEKAADWRFERKIPEMEVESSGTVGGDEDISSRLHAETLGSAGLISVGL
jgi:hypothetical protein